MQGTRVGNYDVVSQLGAGGMGIVYLARHVMLDRPAAIKVLRTEMSHNRDIVTRFFNEARAATAIRHPGIVEIYDFGYLPDGGAYIVMEYIDGESLSQRLVRHGRLPVGYALAICRQIASALQAAHAAQIVHRDLKPENVIILPDPEQSCGDRIKLLDFGIAKLASVSAERSQTHTGEVIGTPTFMSPEQCRGAGKVDARSDLYSLGCLLYVLLCGRPPFEGEGAGDIIAHHLYFAPDPPSKHEPSIPVGVEQLILWLLQKDPVARPSMAAEVMEAIDRLGSSQPAALPPLSLSVLATQKAARPPIQAASKLDTTLSGSASQQRSSVSSSTVVVRRRPRWFIPSAVGGVMTLGAVTALSFGGGENGLENEKERRSALAPALTPIPRPTLPLAPAPAPAPAPAASGSSQTNMSSAPEEGAPAPAPQQVEHVIESNPIGAQVWLDGKLLGRTPFSVVVDLASGSRTYYLQAPGFIEAKVSLPSEQSERRTITLRKRGPAPGPPKSGGGLNPFE